MCVWWVILQKEITSILIIIVIIKCTLFNNMSVKVYECDACVHVRACMCACVIPMLSFRVMRIPQSWQTCEIEARLKDPRIEYICHAVRMGAK